MRSLPAPFNLFCVSQAARRHILLSFMGVCQPKSLRRALATLHNGKDIIAVCTGTREASTAHSRVRRWRTGQRKREVLVVEYVSRIAYRAHHFSLSVFCFESDKGELVVSLAIARLSISVVTGRGDYRSGNVWFAGMVVARSFCVR
eukprot:1549468-Pleurochrysis_carterae.AAC.5